jgi:hypothetical protein
MEVAEWWWIADAKKPRKMYGSLTESEVKKMVAELRDGK